MVFGIFGVICVLLVGCYHDSDPLVPANEVVFSEVTPVNDGFQDQFQKDPGWVELYNPTSSRVSLEGFSLSDGERSWSFGQVILDPYGYEVVFLSGHDEPLARGATHQTSLLGNPAVSWSDQQNDPPGLSQAGPYLFPELKGELHGKPALSGFVELADNSQTRLGWSNASVTLKLKEGFDFSKKNQLYLQGQVDSGASLELFLVQPELLDNKGWHTTLEGNGQENQEFWVDLPDWGGIPDLNHIKGLRFSSPENQLKRIHFTFTQIMSQQAAIRAHASFKLSPTGGRLVLIHPDGETMDSVNYPVVPTGYSYARSLPGGWFLQKGATPLKANDSPTIAEWSSQTASLPPSGWYESPLVLSMPPSGNHEWRCDTTGAEPHSQSPLYAGEWQLHSTASVRCALFQGGQQTGPLESRTYFLNDECHQLPIVAISSNPKSLFDPDTGLMMPGPQPGSDPHYFGANFWWDKELPIHVEYFTPDRQRGWGSPAGLQIAGNSSRVINKKSVAIGFREKYGNSHIEYPLFPEHPHLKYFKWLVLRNNGNNNPKDYIRDPLMTSLTQGLGLDYQKSTPCIVYFNGRYFGIYDLREKSNEHYFKTNYDLDPEAIDLVKIDGTASSGSAAHFRSLMDWLSSHSLRDSVHWAWISKQIDIDNYTNYIQSEIFFVNQDWPGNNQKFWRDRTAQSPWKWFLFDTDYGFNSLVLFPNINMLTMLTDTTLQLGNSPPASTQLFRALLENSAYQTAFVNRFAVLLATYFSPRTIENRMDQLYSAMESEVERDQKIWKLDPDLMEEQMEVIRDFGAQRAGKLRQELREFFQIKNGPDLTLKSLKGGSIAVHQLVLPHDSVTFQTFQNVPITLTAVPHSQHSFVGWSDGETQNPRTITLSNSMSLTAHFR